PWLLGGNGYSTASFAPFILGTCVDEAVSLKAGNRNLVFVNPNGSVGIGEDNANTSSILDISNPVSGNPNNPNQREHLKIHGDYEGTIEATANMKLIAPKTMNLMFNDVFRISETSTGPATVLDITAASTDIYNDVNALGNMGVNGNANISGKT